MGSCDGTFAPTGAPAQFTGLCQYSKCDEENRCTDADVEPWNSRTNYVEGDVIRLDNARFKCREWPYSLWCKQLAFLPTLASDGIWKNDWIANGSCGPTTCKLPKLRTNSNNNTGKPYWVQTGQVMTFFDESSSTRRKRYTNEEPTIQDNDQYVVQCDEPGYIPDEMCVYTCTDGALNAKTYCDVANPEDLCVPIREATFSKQCSLDFDSDEPWHDGKSLKQWWGEVLQKYHSQRAEIFSRESDIPFYLGHGAALLAGYGFAAQHFVGGPTPDAEKDFNADAIELTGWVPRTDYAFGNDSLRGSTTVQAPGYIQNLVTVDVMGTPSVTGPIPDFHPEFKIASLLRDYDPCDDSKYLGFPPECFIYHPAGFHTGSGEMIMFRTPLSNGDIDLQGICTVGETIPPVIIPALNSNMANIGATLGKAGGLTGLHPSSWSMHLCVDDDINHPYLCSVHPNLPVMDNGEYVSVDAIPFVSIPTKMRKKLCAERQAIGPDVCTPNLDTAYPYPWTQHL